MPTSLKELVSFMEELGYSHTIQSEEPEPVITAGFRTSNYRDTDGDPGVQLIIQLLEDGEYLRICAPKAFDLSECQHASAALEVFAGIQWRQKMIRFEYDSEDGEVRPDVGVAFEDATLTSQQFHRLLRVIPGSLDAWYGCIVRAMETGVVDFETPADSTPDPISFDALPEFTELSVGAAAIIGQCKTDLDLSGLESITADDVRALNRDPWSGNKSSWSTFDLDLSGLTTLPREVAEALTHRFDGLPDFMRPATLRLDGIASLSATVAAKLATYPGDLHLNGLSTIDTGVAAALAAHSADLNLDGLTTLGADAAKAIMGHSGNISIDGLTEISDAVAAHLLAVPAALAADDDADADDDSASRQISLGGLERLTPTVAALFVQHAKVQGSGLWLRNLRTLDTATAAVLGQHGDNLNLDGLTVLDATTANELARCRGNISLSGLMSLAPGVAMSLAGHEGALTLDSVRALSDGDAESLSKHKGFLDLGSLRKLSAAGARHLVRHVGELVISIADVADELQDILHEHPSLFQVEPGSPTRLPTAVRDALASASIVEVRATYNGSGDDGGFEAFAVTLADGQVLDDVHDADQLAAALQEACDADEESDARFQPVTQMLYQLIWAALPSGWEIDDGSFGEVVIDVTTGMMTLSHTWHNEDSDDSDDSDDEENSDDEEDEEDEESESGARECPQTDWGDTANQDRLIAADVAELADLLRRGVPRKEWLDAHIDRVPLWEQAAGRGTTHGLMMTGLCHWFGIGREVDHDAARPFLEAAANTGEPQSQFSLGQLFVKNAREGEGTETEGDAYRWFLVSAENGLAQAQFSVAEALWKGEGIEEDERAAVEWMRKAAAQGHGQAAYMLAELHLTNRPSAGIKKDRAMAIEWGRQAAVAGHEEAQGWLKKHEHGVVLTTDIAEQILENWRGNSDRHGPRSRTVGMSIGGDDTEDDDSPPAPSGPFADPPGTTTNSIGMKLVPIPAGEFLMGSSEDCPLGDSYEEFQHRVRITKPFMLGMHQVTQAQYQEVTGENPSFFEGPDLPVEHLSWKHAQRFCELLSSRPAEVQAGRRYRLPTEAEWEYACRAGTTTPFNTGDSLESDQARFASVSRSSPKHTAPVGTYPPNAWGLFDMHGNVWEWTNDWFSADYFRESPVDDPQGPTTGTHHTLRGGSASVESHECRSTIRGEADPADGPDADGSRYAFIGDFGLRVVCVAATAQPHDTVHSAVRSHAHGKAEAVRAISQQFRTRLSEVVDGVTKHINDNNAKEILGPGLSQLMGRGAIKSIVTFALYADVLRMVRDMVMADGEISDDEVQAGLGLMSLLASGFAKVRKDYAPHATLSAETTRAFLSQYEADAGLFGHANESTKWAGVSICRGIQSRCDDSRPLDVFGEALVAWAEAIASSDDITPVEQTALDTLRKYVGQEPSTAHFKQQAREALAAEQGDADAQEALDRLQPSESEAAPTNEDSDQLGSLLAAMDDGSTESAGAVIEYLQATVATPQNAWGVLLHYLDWDCTQPPNPEKDRVGTQSVPLRMPEWGPFAFSHDESLADLVSDEPPAVWQRFKNYFESREVTTVQYGDFEMGYWSAERLADTLTRIYSGTNIKMPVRVFFAAEADGSGIRIFTPLAIGGAIAPPIRASQRWVLEALFRMAEDDSRESVNKQLITIGGLLGRRGTFGKETPLNLHPAPVAWSNETLWVPLGDAWGRLKHPLPQLNVGYLVSKDLKGSAFEDCIDGAVTSLVTLVDWMASAAIENEQVSKQVLPWQPAILLAASASDALVDACHPAELTLAFARAERGDESAAASINEYLESAEDVDINDEDDDEPPPTPIGTFSDPPGTITNSIGMRLVPIPTGEFLMGSPADSPLGDSDEEFQHKVRITKPFLLGMHQVTQSQYEHVTGDNPSFFRGPQLPVEHLAWKDAKRFCDLLSALPGERQAGRRYRLPTEAEWEYACRAGTTTPFSTGDALEPDQARFAATNRSSPKQTAPVGTYPPNAWGLFDMHGNVWEWTSDWFSADYYRESPLNDPQGPASGTHHALRGGSASMEGHECHAAFRGEAAAVDGPETETLERIAFYGDLGIRVVCEATTKREPLGPSSLTHKLEPGTMRGRDALAENQPRQGTDNAATSPPPPPASDPTNSLSSRTVRIFISSTFRDFAGERDLLVRKVFPELRRRCRERQVELVDVDLRWGITEAEAEQGKVLPICLTEIDRARPFFMGLLGERYGWVPAVGQFDRSLLIEQPWLEEHAGEKSVTELEILHGVLNNPQMAGRAFFYFRDPAWSATQGADYTTESEAERQKLADLKVRIRESGFPVSEGYADPSTLAGIVLEDLWTALDKEFPAGTEPTPLEREALDHSAFAASRYTVFVGRDEHLQSLSNQVTHDRQPIVVIGEPGSGKSALLANWVRLQRSRATSAWIFEHYVGASAQSTTYADLIRRIIAEIASTLSIQAEVSDATADLVRQFPEWLEKLSAELKAKGTSAVLVLDGLDQMQDEDSAAELRWLPQQFPAGVQVMVSAQPGFGLETLKKRSWPIVSLPLLAEPDRKTLVRESLARYRKSLTTERLNLLASALAAANPLFLKALVDELRVCASHETLDEQIRNYLEASDPPALFAKVLERIETDHEADAPGLVRDALRLVWAARDGCSEAELLVLLKRPGEDHLPQAVWSPVYVAIEPFLVRRAGLYTLCHAFFRQAVQERYFADEKDARAAHRTLADFFEQQRPSPRAEREVPWQLYEAAEHGRLNAYLRLPGNFMPLLKNAANDLSRFLSVACANQDKSEFIRHVVTDHLTQQPDSWAQDILLVLWPLENLCERIGESPYWVGKFLNDNRPATLRRKFSVDTRGPKLLSMAAVADGSFTSQVDELVLETEDARIDPLCYAVKNAESLLYDCHYGDGVPADSTTTLTDIHSEMRRLLDAAERGFGQRAELETDYVTAEDEAYAWRSARREYLLLIGEIRALMAEKEEDYEQAHALLDGALVMAEGFWGTSHVELLPVLRAIVNTAKTSGDPSRGLSAAHRGLSLCLTDGGPTHPDIKWWLENYCHRSIDLGELAIAEDLCSEVLKKQESLVGTDHVELAYTLQTRAKVRYHSDDPTREKQDYQRALSILDAADEPDEDLRKSIVEQYETFVAEEHAADHNLAVQLVLQGDYSAAEPLFRRILEGKEQSLGLEHPATLTSVSFLALSLKSQRDYSAAESLHRRALEGREKVLGPDHLATLVSVDNLMFLLRQQGDYAAAEPLCRRALAGREKALGPDHPDTLKSVHNLALLLCNQGDYAAAEGLFRTAVAGYERALGPDHDDTLSCINNLAECVDALTPPAVRGSGGKGG